MISRSPHVRLFQSMYFIGIDPGKSGAIAVIDHEGRVCRTCVFDEREYRIALMECSDTPGSKAVLEHVGAMPGQGSVSMFNFGSNFGFIRGLLTAYEIPYELVRPQKWKRMFSCTSDKNTSVDVAQRLFPDVDLRRTPRCSKPHDGIAEALLMAEYCRRTNLNSIPHP